LTRLAEKQHGVYSRAQALGCGLSSDTIDRRVSSAAWERLYPGIYRLAGVRATWKQSLLAACLAWGAGAVSSHRAAAALRELVGFSPGPIELIVPRKRERAYPHVVHRPRVLDRVDISVLDAIPVATAARTLIDLATCVGADVLEEALDDALRRELVSLRFLRRRAEQLGARTVLKHLLDARAGVKRGPESRLETKVLRALRAAGLPKPAVQHRIGRYRVDFAYVDARVAIECDGYRYHSGRRAFDDDRARQNALTAMGWRVLRVTWPQLRDRPEEVIGAILAVGTLK